MFYVPVPPQGTETEKMPHYVTPPHEPDLWRPWPTINADVLHMWVVPGTQTSQGKGEGGGRSMGSAKILYSAKQRYH